MEADLIERIEASCNLLKSPVIAADKERRQFMTTSTLSAVYRSPYSYFIPPSPDLGPMSTMSFETTVERTLQATWIEALDFKDKDRIIAVTPSLKTRLASGPTVRSSIKATINRYMRPGVAADLKSVMESLEAGSYTTPNSGAMITNPYFVDLYRCLARTWPSDDVLTEFRTRWPRPPSLDLKVKLYVQRGDVRAYAADRNCARALVGSILHAIMLPRGDREHDKMPHLDIWPRKGKNIVHETVYVPHHDTIGVGGGDVSSFTTSNLNIWTRLFSLAQRLESKSDEQWNKPILVLVESKMVEVIPLQVLKSYLYLAPFDQIWDTFNESFYRPRGGVLGMSGVNTIACVLFAISLKALESNAKLNKITLKFKQGGDDFRMRMIGQLHKLRAFAHLIREVLVTTIGQLKEFELEILAKHYDDCVQEQALRYCKKLICYTWVHASGDMFVKFDSVYRLPLSSQLMADARRDPVEERKQFLDFYQSLFTVIPWDDDQDYYIEVYVRLWQELRGPQNLENVASETCIIPDFYGPDTSPGVQRKLDLIKLVTGPSGTVYGMSEADQLLLLNCFTDLRRIRQNRRVLTCLASEQRRLVRLLRPMRRHDWRIVPDSVVKSLVDDLRRLRELARNYVF